MVNIQALKNKSIGTIKQIFIKLDSLHLNTGSQKRVILPDTRNGVSNLPTLFVGRN